MKIKERRRQGRLQSGITFMLVMFALVFGAGFLIGYFTERTGMVYTQSEIGRLTRALAAYRRRIRPRRNNRPGRARTAGRGVARATSRSSQKTEARSPVRGRARRGTERRGK